MIELIVQLALSNLVVSVALAMLAHAVDRHGRYPAIAHALWVLVLLKVLTPPLVTLPLVPVGSATIPGGAPAFSTDSASALGGIAAWADIVDLVLPALLVTWVIGSAFVLAVSLLRIRRFDRLLRRTSHEAAADIQALAAAIATTLAPSQPADHPRHFRSALPADLVDGRPSPHRHPRGALRCRRRRRAGLGPGP